MRASWFFLASGPHLYKFFAAVYVSAIKAHAAAKMCQAVKFVEFARQNKDAPFSVKLKVFHACVMSSVLYACETWLQGDLRPVAKLYNMCVKSMLGVRNTTCNDLCYLELGIPPVKALVMKQQRHFLQTLYRGRVDHHEDPWKYAVSLTIDARLATGRYLHDLLVTDVDDVSVAMQHLKRMVETSQSSRRNKYALMNPTMNVHHVYRQRIANPMQELHRQAFTRFRISAHSHRHGEVEPRRPGTSACRGAAVWVWRSTGRNSRGGSVSDLCTYTQGIRFHNLPRSSCRRLYLPY